MYEYILYICRIESSKASNRIGLVQNADIRAHPLGGAELFTPSPSQSKNTLNYIQFHLWTSVCYHHIPKLPEPNPCPHSFHIHQFLKDYVTELVISMHKEEEKTRDEAGMHQRLMESKLKTVK